MKSISPTYGELLAMAKTAQWWRNIALVNLVVAVLGVAYSNHALSKMEAMAARREWTRTPQGRNTVAEFQYWPTYLDSRAFEAFQCWGQEPWTPPQYRFFVGDQRADDGPVFFIQGESQ